MMIHDLRDPRDPQGRTYKQVNAEKQHAIPIGSLVELSNGVRLFVVSHVRDCDQTPLYYLAPDQDDTIEQYPGFMNRSWVGGFSERYLKVIALHSPEKQEI